MVMDTSFGKTVMTMMQPSGIQVLAHLRRVLLNPVNILDDGYAQLGDDGNYWIDPDGSGAFEVYCDMTTDGGGWSILA